MNKNLFSTVTDKKCLLLIFIYIISLLIGSSKMSPLYAANEWSDPNIYFNVGKAMVHGKTLYTEVFDHKGPLIFFIYAAGYLISNDSFFGMFIIELSFWLVLAYSLYFTARIYLGKAASCIVSISFFLFLVELMKAGGSAEEFILCFESVSLYFFLKYFNSGSTPHKPGYMLLHGAMVTATLLIKINLIIFWFFPLLFIFIKLLLQKEFKNFILNVLAYIAGTVIVSMPILGYLWTHDALEEAYNIYIVLNKSYAKLQSLPKIISLLLFRTMYLFLTPMSLLLFAPIGIFYFPIKCMKNKIEKWSIVLSGISLYSSIFIGKFQYYYPIPFIIFSALGLIGVSLYLRKYVSLQLTTKSLSLVCCICLFAGLSIYPPGNTLIDEYFLREPENRSLALQTDRLKKEITKEKNPTLLNLGFGMGNSLFSTCNIVPNVKYFIRPNLSYDFYPELRKEQFEYIKNKKTQFVIIQEFVAIKELYKGDNPVDRPDFLKRLPALAENYRLVLSDTIVNKIDENSTEVYFLYKRK